MEYHHGTRSGGKKCSSVQPPNGFMTSSSIPLLPLSDVTNKVRYLRESSSICTPDAPICGTESILSQTASSGGVEVILPLIPPPQLSNSNLTQKRPPNGSISGRIGDRRDDEMIYSDFESGGEDAEPHGGPIRRGGAGGEKMERG